MSQAVVDRLAVSEEALLDEETPVPAAPSGEVSFADLGLPVEVVRVLTKRGVTTPFPIQAATIPDALTGRDVLGQGRTGSGKTLSFGLPLVSRLAGGSSQPRRPRGLVLAPTRELAVQISEALEPFGSALGLRFKVVCGGTSMTKQIQALERGVDVLVATPGRLSDLIRRKACLVDQVEIAILDEADQMADLGFLPEVRALLDQIPVGGQRMLFSATLGRGVDTIVDQYLTEPVSHSVDPAAGVSATMSHHQVLVKPRDKASITAAIAGRHARAIAFVRTQLGAERVAGELKEAGVVTAALHGGMSQHDRSKVLNGFKEGKVPLLVATDVAARGIDVDGIDLVLHVDPPADSTDYLHRAGRTARAGRSGVVVMLVLPHQQRSSERLLEQAGVAASFHEARGLFDANLAALIGARSLTGIQAEVAAIAARNAQREVIEATRQLERCQRNVGQLEERASELTARAEAEARGEVPIPDDRGPRNRSERGARGGKPAGKHRTAGGGSGKRPYRHRRAEDAPRGGAKRSGKPAQKSWGDNDRKRDRGDRG